LHPDAIKAAFDVDIAVNDVPDENGKCVPKLFGEAFSIKRGHGAALKDSSAKNKLAELAFPQMTAAMIDARDPGGEVRQWFIRLKAMLGAE